MERKGIVFRKYGKREQTSSEKPFKVLFKLGNYIRQYPKIRGNKVLSFSAEFRKKNMYI